MEWPIYSADIDHDFFLCFAHMEFKMSEQSIKNQGQAFA